MQEYLKKTPLDDWFLHKTGLLPQAENINDYQLENINATLRYIRDKSPFYHDLLSGHPQGPLENTEDMNGFPLTDAGQLREDGERFICVGQDEISRIVTLLSSGTTAKPKRVFFTKDDQELTVDFFAYGMQTFAGPGEKVLVLLPGERPGSVGALLAEALSYFGAIPLIHGLPHSYREVLEIIAKEKPVNMVAAPQTALALSCLFREMSSESPFKSILLSTDYAAESLVENISKTWSCPVYQHYGMTEMGLGGAVYCHYSEGYHIRAADLYLEVIDPESGGALPQGAWGEIVFTTLNRRAMPLFRYRTGDWGRLSACPCSCGSQIPLLGAVGGRIKDDISLKGGIINPRQLDEIIFTFPKIGGYDAAIAFDDQKCRLYIEIYALKGLDDGDIEEIARELTALKAFEPYLMEKFFKIEYNIKKALPLPEILKKKEICLL